jgi:hypothetical protein
MTGFVKGEDASVLDQLPACSAPVNALDANLYHISCNGGVDDHYRFVYQQAVYTVLPAQPVVTVTGGEYHFDGLPHPALADARGIYDEVVTGTYIITYNGLPAEPVDAGTYQVEVRFTSTNRNYLNATGTAVITISKVSDAPEILYPENGRLLPPGMTGILLLWKPVVADQTLPVRWYEVELAADAGFTSMYTRGFTPFPLWMAWVQPNQTWYWRVRAVYYGGSRGDWSQAAWFATSKTHAPLQMEPANNRTVKGRTVTFSWMPSPGIPPGSEYTLQYGSDPSFAPGTYTGLAGLRFTSLRVTQLPENSPRQRVYWRVKAASPGGAIDYSDWQHHPASFLR